MAANLASWICEVCTMGNDASNMICFMCQKPRIQLKDLDVKWEWHPNPDQWLAYDYESIVQIEEAYQNWKSRNENEQDEEEDDKEEDMSEEEEDVDAGSFASMLFGSTRPPAGLVAPVPRKFQRGRAAHPAIHQVHLSKGWFKMKRGYIIDFSLNVQMSPAGNQRQVRRIASDSDDIFEPYCPEVVDTSNRNADEPLEAPKCVICQFEYEDGDDLVKLRVCSGHGFHRACILNWINLNNKCPLCNTPIS